MLLTAEGGNWVWVQTVFLYEGSEEACAPQISAFKVNSHFKQKEQLLDHCEKNTHFKRIQKYKKKKNSHTQRNKPETWEFFFFKSK